jgi:anti-sigma B factor antagonist
MSLADEFRVQERLEFEIRISVDDDRRVIQPCGELDLATTEQLRAALLAAFDATPGQVVLDLSRLEFIDSTGIHLILEASRTAGGRDHKLVLVPGPRQIRRSFDLAGITERLQFAD